MGSGEHEIPQGPDTVGPSLGEKLNPGIVQLVKLLNEAGFETTDSGDGETHDHDCDRDHGYVVIMLADRTRLVEETDRLKTVLRSAGILVVPQDMGRPEVGCCYVQAMYCPADRFAIIDVMHVHDRMIRG